MSLITCENLTLGYEGKAILSGLNFSVNSGDYLCIVGENGSGKSTLMKTLLHLQTRALCATRKILLLDEPVSGLDPVATADMYQIINELNKEDQVTIIMISHDISEVATYASHVLHIGQKVFFGTKEEYLESKIGKRLVDAGEEGKA